MKSNLLLTLLAMIMSLSIMAQSDSAVGTWEYKPTGTKMEIQIDNESLTTEIDGYNTNRTYTKVSGDKYKSNDIDNLYLEIVSNSKIITYNTATNSQNTWHKFGAETRKSSSKSNQSRRNDNSNLASTNSNQKSYTTSTSNSSRTNAYKQTKVAHSSRSSSSSFLSLGVGFLSSYAGGGGIPPLSISYNRTLMDNIMVGGFFSYAQTNFDTGLGSEFDWGYRFMTIGARGTYHFDLGPQKLDPYAGVILGYTIGTITGNCIDCNASTVAYSGLLGARYHVTEKIIPFVELGYGLSALTVGISWNL